MRSCWQYEFLSSPQFIKYTQLKYIASETQIVLHRPRQKHRTAYFNLTATIAAHMFQHYKIIFRIFNTLSLDTQRYIQVYNLYKYIWRERSFAPALIPLE